MKKFGELNGVTASSLLLLGENSIDFLKACNKSLDEMNLASMSSELSYINSIRKYIEDILKTKPEFSITGSQDSEKIMEDLLSALTVIIRNRTGLSFSSYETTNFFSEGDLFGDIFSNDVEDFSDDVFGDEEFKPNVNESKEELLDSISIMNLIEFSKTPEYINNSLEISEIDVNNLMDELIMFKDKYNVFEARCKQDIDSQINESVGIKRIVSSGRGNTEVIDFISKSYTRISLFNLSFKELSGLLKEIESSNLLNENKDSEIDLSEYSDKVISIGDNLAYLIYSNISKTKNNFSSNSELLTRLISFCDIKSTKSSNESKILGIPLNLCYLKFKGANYRSFCENLELYVSNIPDTTLETYKLTIKHILDSIQIIYEYIKTITFNRKNDIYYEKFKIFVRSYILGSDFGENFSQDMFEFMEELSNRKLIPSRKELDNNSETAIYDYAGEIYDTFKLYSLSDKFSMDYYNSILPIEIIDNFGVMDIDTFIEVNKYLKDMYKIIPLTISNYVKSRILATSKTNKVLDKEVYNEVLPFVSLLVDNYNSKYETSGMPGPGTLVIS